MGSLLLELETLVQIAPRLGYLSVDDSTRLLDRTQTLSIMPRALIASLKPKAP